MSVLVAVATATQPVLEDAARPGRSCPLAYRYPASVFNRKPDLEAATVYVVGGVYGNEAALDALEALTGSEAAPPAIVFNGDFNWFNIDAPGFARINARVLAHTALRGNVETEIAGEPSDAGCGCAYPDDVSDAEVARSNAILDQLRGTALAYPSLRAELASLPANLVVKVSGVRVGVVHGDAESIAGWGFAYDQLAAPSARAWLEGVFAAAGVDVFASSHTCLPALAEFAFGTVANNGAAGMPNFAGQRFGLVTRIGTTPPPVAPVLGTQVRGVRIDLLPLAYDWPAWDQAFLANWPPGSDAHLSYWQRLAAGPSFAPGTARIGAAA